MMEEQKSHISVLHDIRGKVLVCGIKNTGTGAKNKSGHTRVGS